MNYRIYQEQLEEQILSPVATCSNQSKGRKKEEKPCDIRTVFQRDRDRILHSKSFRRLKHKTQVFIAPEGDHYRTRLTHTLEVSQIARTIGKALRLNEDLIEAIALGHDLGHTPFGHTGEFVLNQLHKGGFKHYKQSLRVVDILEHNGKRQGLNLTFEVRDGIVNHTGERKANTEEGSLIKFADRIAYINHDIDDAQRAGIISAEDIPKEIIEILGKTHSERINSMIHGMIEYGEKNGGKVGMVPEIENATNQLRQFMFENVYYNPTAKSEDDKVARLLEDLYKYYLKHFESLPKEHIDLYKKYPGTEDDIICDYIAGMTDRFAVTTWKNLVLPKYWKG
ncbi:MAG: deoxyguanosinetriphosphate triphosphohydrolase [Tissierellia bacterium]|nr:deoxyguanosinetriphosphate triphosphohydrolase [Tissierellia bacterium]